MKETIEFIVNEARKREIQELIEKGYQWRCLGCNAIYKQPSQQLYEDGHGDRMIDMCYRCGSDLFQKLGEASCLDVKVEQVDGAIVLKEHHFKYCVCNVGEVWCGQAEYECGAPLELLEEAEDKKIYHCGKSGLKIIILKSTKEEMNGPDEVGSRYIRLP